MDIIAFLNDPRTRTPQRWEGADLLAAVESIFEKYCSAIDELCFPNGSSFSSSGGGLDDAIKTLCDRLRDVFVAYLQGSFFEAYELLREILEHSFSNLQSNRLTLEKGNDLFFRCRLPESESITTKEQMFHIPFEQRHKVSNDRYSIHGLPCLYLSGSLYTCWHELGAPPLHKICCSGLWIKGEEPLIGIDLRNPILRWRQQFSGKIPEMNGIWEKDFLLSIVTWPLVAACSIDVQHRTSPFKPEYCVPQLMLEWIRRNDEFDFVCYTSAKAAPTIFRDARFLGANFAFPAKDIHRRGRCPRLCKTFRITSPALWELLLQGRELVDMPTPVVADLIEIMDGSTTRYHETQFRKAENVIRRVQKMMVETQPDRFDIDPNNS